MLIDRFMSSVAGMSISVPGLVALEVREGRCSATGERTMVAMVRIVAVIYVAVESMRPMEPRASPDE